MSISTRPLAGMSINLSVSESLDSAERGFPTWQVNRVSLQLVSALFGQGMTVVFGHDWRQDGVMEAMLSFAQQMRAPVGLSEDDARVLGEPMLRNILAWPDVPSLSADDIDALSPTLQIEGPVLPEDLREEAQRVSGMTATSEFKYVRARALTYLRRRLTGECTARLCLGGRLSGSQGFLPGVLEEAVLSLDSHRPLYMSDLFGGASQEIIWAIEGKPMPKSFCPDFKAFETPLQFADGVEASRFQSRAEIWDALQNFDEPSIAETNKLSIEQQRELFHTSSVDRLTELLLIGLSHLRQPDQD
ncbi:MAG TPA: hypothetical protein VMT95_09785 [Candidatus Binatia bacterium]|nr:hypothetical protein [Candidatus Binatia bacterium]